LMKLFDERLKSAQRFSKIWGIIPIFSMARGHSKYPVRGF
jgi:hypothetical protein